MNRIESRQACCRPGVPVKLATYSTTGLIILMHVGGDMVNGLRLIILAARVSLLAQLEATRRVSGMRLSIILNGKRAEVGLGASHEDGGASWLLAILLILSGWLQVNLESSHASSI